MATDTLDVLIIGAGLAGIGAAVHVRQHCPQHRLALLEARPRLGGTWDIFRFPGVRCDSNIHTLAYRFRPWRGPERIADGPRILQYLQDTAVEHDIAPLIRYQHRVVAAHWCSQQARWRLEVEHTVGTDADGAHATEASVQRLTMHARFVLMCAGYFHPDEGHAPPLPGQDQFQGRLVHPQHWPEDLNLAGQRVVVLGSGATAITLAPTLARQAAHVTVLQRSPSHVLSTPRHSRLIQVLTRLGWSGLGTLGSRWASMVGSDWQYAAARRWPRWMRQRLLAHTARHLHDPTTELPSFSPRYAPWTQRVCFTPDAELFQAQRSGRLSMHTGEVDTLTPTGVQLRSGQHLPADCIVTATGLQLRALGGVQLTVDGRPVVVGKTWTYRGMMLAGVPNLVYSFGTMHNAWTLQTDLCARWATRVLNHLRHTGHDIACPQAPAGLRPAPYTGLTAGYVLRAAGQFPRQADQAPWQATPHHLPRWWQSWQPVDDGVLRFSRRPYPPA